MVFKAEIGALSTQVALIQGVWVHPRHRGQGISAPGTAAVVDRIRRLYRRLPSLYVNQDNLPARASLRPGRVQSGRHVRLGPVLRIRAARPAARPK